MADRELIWWLFVICFVPWMMTDYLRLPSVNIYFYRSMYTKMLDSRWCICLYTRMPLPRTNTTKILNGKIYGKWIVECITCQYIVHKLYNIEMNYINKYIILLVILHTRIASEYIILNLEPPKHVILMYQKQTHLFATPNLLHTSCSSR